MTSEAGESVRAVAAALRAEAQRADHRRVLVLAGDPASTRTAALAALDAAEVSRAETTVVGGDASEGPLDACERLEAVRAGELLGRTRTAVVLDAHEASRPNALGAAVGAVDGGGLLLLLAPPLDEWPERRDGFDEGIAVPPFGVDDVTGRFRRRLVATLRAHPGIAIASVDADGATVSADGLTDPAPRLPPGSPAPPADHAFPAAAYDACRTDDQVSAVRACEALADPGAAVVIEADRGRGKSSAAGLAAAALALDGADVLVTAPQYRSCREAFLRAADLLDGLDALADRDGSENPQRLATDEGVVRYADPEDAVASLDADGGRSDGGRADEESADGRGDAADGRENGADCDCGREPDVVIVDEAAALPVRTLAATLDAPAVAYATTVHGYEGAGRGFSVRFRDRLAESDRAVTDVSMTAPIRYAPADPVESWLFRALMLDARPAADPLVAGATPETVTYDRLDADALVADEHLLREAFGLLVLAHYRTEPDDLARLLDAPNVDVRALSRDGHVASVALLAREGDLPASLRSEMYEGARVRGNMLPDVLTTQLRDEAAGEPVGRRVLRIATHPAVRSRGLGSRLLGEVRAEYADRVDWLGVGYGATPALVSFWAENGYETVHCSTTRNDASGEYSALMLDPCSDAGRSLADRHAAWFRERVAGVLSDPLDDLDPDVARAVLRATAGTPPVDLSTREWRHVTGVPTGATTYDLDPGPFRRLALRHLVDPAPSDSGEGVTDRTEGLTDRQERLLVRKVLQGRPWDAVAAEFDFVSTSACMREMGSIVERLVRLYADESVRKRLEDH